MPTPNPGQMYLYDEVTPPLQDNSYRLTVETDVSYTTTDPTGKRVTKPLDLPSAQTYFDVQGPRFRLASTEVVAVFPPRNGHGDFSSVIPHIVLQRRTLPWERPLAADADLPAVTPDPDLAPPNPLPQPPSSRPFVAPPWLALLVFEGDEASIQQSVQLTSDYVPANVLQALGLPTPNTGITCDILQTSYPVLNAILPSLQELTVLCHARQVNVDDRELNVGGGDGWFSVVMSNRLPNAGAKCLACLVSLEQRTDVIFGDPPAVAGSGLQLLVQKQPAAAALGGAARELAVVAHGQFSGGGVFRTGPPVFFETVNLILLHSWKFESAGSATFRELMQNLDVGMLGVVSNPGHPPIADTGHMQLELQDRAGTQETVWYRGPLSPHQLTRDILGPYHSADQALRASPETGALDISYAAAFEAGRLIAAADSRLGQDLMRWRREAYKVAALGDSLNGVEQALPAVTGLDPHVPASTSIAPGATAQYVNRAGPLGDPYGLNLASKTIGFSGAALQQAWGLGSPQEALNLLGANPGILGAAVSAPAQTVRNNTTIDTVASDAANLGRLSSARNQAVSNFITRAGGGS